MKHRKQQRQLLRQFDLDVGDSVIVAHAHPDDESVASGALISRLVAAKVIVHVVTATDGENSILGDQRLVRNGYRRLEAILALLKAGVQPRWQHFWGEPDGELHMPAVHDRITRRLGELATRHHVRAIFTPGLEFDDHADHRAMHVAALMAAKNLEQPPAVWGLTREADPQAVRIPVDTAEKLAMVRQHASQFPDITDTTVSLPTARYLTQYADLIWGQENYRLY